MSENKENKIVVDDIDDIDIVVRGVKDKPYYEIKYREVGNNHHNIGFGSYDLNNVLKWKEEYFEVVQNRETKQEVINEELLEYLKLLEEGQHVTITAFGTLFALIGEIGETKKLELSSVASKTLKMAITACDIVSNKLKESYDTEDKEEDSLIPDDIKEVVKMLFGL